MMTATEKQTLKDSDDAVVQSLEKLRIYIEGEEFKGYDPYDTLNSPIPFQWFTRYGQAVITQIQKRNPVNIRPLLGIKKEYNPKGLGLLLHAYCLLGKESGFQTYQDQITFLYNWLSNNRSKNFNNACWGYNFGWASPEKYLPPFAPTVVATSFIATGIFEYYHLTKDDNALTLLTSIGKFITEDLPVTEFNDGICFSYSPFMKDCCYNASLLGAETLARIYSLTEDEKLKSICEKAVDFVVNKQHSDGHWEYKINPDTGAERHQVDFHQGYVIDSIRNVIKYTGLNKDSWTSSIKKGLDYYHYEQFFPEGRSKWRVPVIYPVEIHNQSQGIITFAESEDKTHRQFADAIVSWTIENMQDPTGYFYYRKLKYYTNKLSFMRWGNAWMFLAMTKYLISRKEQ